MSKQDAERGVTETAIAYATQRAESAAASARKSVESYSYHTGRERAYEEMRSLLQTGIDVIDSVVAAGKKS